MLDTPDDLQQRIAHLEALRATLGDTAVDAAIAALRAEHTPASPLATSGVVTVSDTAQIYGPTVGVNLGQIIYGRDPQEDERRRLVWYLDSLANRLYRLPLRGLDPKLDDGGAGLSLPHVYVTLATTSTVLLDEGSVRKISSYFEANDLNRPPTTTYNPDWALPPTAIVTVQTDPQQPAWVRLHRALGATEAVQRHQRLVLLGDPGSGKSTFLRYLAWILARQSLHPAEDTPTLVGWDAHRPVLPLLLPLRKLAGRVAQDSASAQTVVQTLRDEMETYGVQQVDDLLTAALVRGTALLLLDGLDEIPVEATPSVADRLTTLRAVRACAHQYPQVPMVITCRTRAFDPPLQTMLGWPTETITPFTLGQMRQFMLVWYGEMTATGEIDRAHAEQLRRDLLAAIVQSDTLRTMAGTPLLLTLMALVLYNRGLLPRDRPLLYEAVLELLLGQWDKVKEGQSLADVVGRSDWVSDRFRPLLDRLSYQAHLAGSSTDGRGRLDRRVVRDALIDFFEGVHVPEPWSAARRCLDYFEHRSGLLIPDGSDSYVFAHLTLQEHCAGRFMLLDRHAATLVLHHRTDDRWREPIFLGLGVVQQTNPWLIESVLRKLIDCEVEAHPKPGVRWYQDLILAAEIGNDRDWNYLREQRVDIAPIQRDLRRGLVTLLHDRSQPLPVADRVRSGFLLGALGDPRYPVTLAAWEHAIRHAQGVAPTDTSADVPPYLCCVPAGTYTIGSDADDPDARDGERPLHQITLTTSIMIARYPITNAQWRVWEHADQQRTYFATDRRVNHPNQPVVGISWHMATAFCAWLSARLGLTVRLPTEYEWEAAARGGDTRRYPWGDAESDDGAATQEDATARGWSYTVPVGCYPAGAAPGGALDMAGNVWEWTADPWRSYPGTPHPVTDPIVRVLRGGAGNQEQVVARCAARLREPPYMGGQFYGFRVVVVLPERPAAETRADG